MKEVKGGVVYEKGDLCVIRECKHGHHFGENEAVEILSCTNPNGDQSQGDLIEYKAVSYSNKNNPTKMYVYSDEID